jgi:hypothetical protein
VIPPDEEIFEVEQRIAARRAQVVRHSRDAGRRAMQALASPVALIAAAGLGFLAARAMSKRDDKPKHPERRKSDHMKAAKATGLAGMVVPAVMWLVRAQWGSPVRAAQALLQKWQGAKAQGTKAQPKKAPTSLRGDMTRP